VRGRACYYKGMALLAVLLFLNILFPMAFAMASGYPSSTVLSSDYSLPEEKSLRQKLEETDQSLSEWDKVDKSVFADRMSIPEMQVGEQISRLDKISSYYRRMITALKKGATLTAEAKRLEGATAQPVETFVSSPPPFSLSLYQSYVKNGESLDARISELERSVKKSRSARRNAVDAYEKAAERVKVLGEQIEKADPEAGSRPDWEYRVAKTDEQLYSVILEFLDIRDFNLDTEIKTAKLLGNRNERCIKWIKDNLHYDEADLNDRVSELDKDITALKSEIERLEKEKSAVERKLIKVQDGADAAVGADKLSATDVALKEQQVWWEYYQSRIEHSEEMIQLLSEAKSLWSSRYSLLKDSPDTGTLFQIRDRVSKRREALQQSLLDEQGRISAINSRLSAAEQILERNRDKEALPYLKGMVSALERYLEEDHLRYASKLNMVLDANSRLLEEVEERLHSVQITKKVTTLGREQIMGILQTELWSDKDYSLTVRKLILAILILVIGLFVTKRLTVRLKNNLGKRNMDPSAVMVIQKLFYYILIIIFILITLNMVNIPLTAFAFLGGALAIAVGLGAQNLFRNFITGFIIMLEKPFKVNDIVQVDGTVATVVEIGSRATTVRDFDNVEMMIPNSHFLDNNIINWTHSDMLIRGSVSVGVAYGSTARKVEELLMEVAGGHSKVLKRPEPYVVFRDFGDSALIFELYFYVDMKNASRFFVASDLRYMIDNVFAKNDIVIAFPQMDVHMDIVRDVPDNGVGDVSEGDEDDH